ncbi:putative peptidase [Maioricimonas rarisocia]|uniref:Putative peptidase n=1 Tax=Maioricimonas rarisocia TaxID=2528026 RepID=A0A517Z7U4_9PLAN|nr:Xaa-Pro peptidase family protein [Maioricimonas rarisocia]QDU38548.1 putative peptidase [Maioricimonas rarisocia]
MSDRFEARRKKLLRLLRDEGLPAMLVTAEKNVSYLTGFTGDSSYLLLGRDLAVVISDSRYTTQLKEECPTLDAVIRKTDVSLPQAAARVLRKAKLSQLAFEGQNVTFELHQKLADNLAQVELVPLNGRIESDLRAIKDADEINELRLAVQFAARGFEFLKATLTHGMTEREISHDLEHAMRRFGAEGVSFTPIIAVGDRAALPHYHPGDLKVEESPILLTDWGAQTRSGYRSDLTRVLVTGRPTAKLEKVYNVVLEAQQRAIAAIGPGVVCRDVDKAARETIHNAGYGKRFGHGLGHGIGLDIHEQPRLAPVSETILQPGMVVTVEPGIYLPGWGGVRIEDDVLVTRDGHEVLSNSVPNEFEQAFVDLGN